MADWVQCIHADFQIEDMAVSMDSGEETSRYTAHRKIGHLIRNWLILLFGMHLTRQAKTVLSGIFSFGVGLYAQAIECLDYAEINEAELTRLKLKD